MVFYYDSKKEKTKALAIRKELFEIYNKMLGPSDPKTIHSQMLLGCSYEEDDDIRNAFETYERALSKCKDEKVIIQLLELLERCYTKKGEFENMLQLKGQALAQRIKVFGKDHPVTIKATANLAMIIKLVFDFFNQ